MAATYTVGDGKTYSTIQSAIDAIPGNLSGQGIQTVEVYTKAAGYTERLNILTGFSNAGASDYIDLGGMVATQGVAGNGILITYSDALSQSLILAIAYTRIHDLEWTGTWTTGWYGINLNASGSNCKIYNNVFHDIASSNGASSMIVISCNAANCEVYNNVIYNISHSGASNRNCFGIILNGSGFTTKNTVAMNCTSNDLDWGGGTHDYNVSSDATATGANSQPNKTAANQFVSVTGGSEDFNVKDSSADIYHAGVASGQLSSEDIYGTAWNSPPSIGAFEFLTTGGGGGGTALLGTSSQLGSNLDSGALGSSVAGVF
jgi:hypothetical protein